MAINKSSDIIFWFLNKKLCWLSFVFAVCVRFFIYFSNAFVYSPHLSFILFTLKIRKKWCKKWIFSWSFDKNDDDDDKRRNTLVECNTYYLSKYENTEPENGTVTALDQLPVNWKMINTLRTKKESFQLCYHQYFAASNSSRMYHLIVYFFYF